MSHLGGVGVEFKRVKVSPEMVGITFGWLTILVFVWDLNQDMSAFRAEVSDDVAELRTEMFEEISKLRTEMFSHIANLNDRMANLSERMAHVEGLLQGYIEQSRTTGEVAATE